MTTDEILVRALDVSTRRFDDGGLLLETLIGRYTLDRDARDVWFLIDGKRALSEVAAAVAARRGLPVEVVREPVFQLGARLHELRLVERR